MQRKVCGLRRTRRHVLESKTCSKCKGNSVASAIDHLGSVEKREPGELSDKRNFGVHVNSDQAKMQPASSHEKLTRHRGHKAEFKI